MGRRARAGLTRERSHLVIEARRAGARMRGRAARPRRHCTCQEEAPPSSETEAVLLPRPRRLACPRRAAERGRPTVPTNQGYANFQLATEKKKIKGLKLVQLGCLGETTTTMMNGGICHYAAGNQLAQAVSFIHKHKISLITLDIGANDIDGCVQNGTVNFVCVGQGINTIQTNVPMIANTLRQAAGRKVRIVGMTYYDPFLADWLTGPSGQAIAQASVGLAQQVNTDLTNDYQAQSFKVADVATAYQTYTPLTSMTTLPPYGRCRSRSPRSASSPGCARPRLKGRTSMQTSPATR